MTEDQLAEAGARLGQQCAFADVEENHLAFVVAHLNRRRDVAATRALIANLPKSPFAKRSRKTGEQLEALRAEIDPVLANARSWQDAARIVGWAKRTYRSALDGFR